MKRNLTGLALVFTVVLSLVAFAGCKGSLSDEDRVRAVLDEAIAGAEGKDVAAVIALVSKDFTDDHGNDYRALKGLLLREMLRKGYIRIVLRDLTIIIEGERATAEGRALLARGRDAESLATVLPEDMTTLFFSLVLDKIGGEWRIIIANWHKAGPGSFL